MAYNVISCHKVAENTQILSPGVLRRGAPGVSRHGAMGFRGAAQGFEGRRHGVSRGGATDKRLQ